VRFLSPFQGSEYTIWATNCAISHPRLNEGTCIREYSTIRPVWYFFKSCRRLLERILIVEYSRMQVPSLSLGCEIAQFLFTTLFRIRRQWWGLPKSSFGEYKALRKRTHWCENSDKHSKVDLWLTLCRNFRALQQIVLSFVAQIPCGKQDLRDLPTPDWASPLTKITAT
jgi:hypothetical protein